MCVHVHTHTEQFLSRWPFSDQLKDLAEEFQITRTNLLYNIMGRPLLSKVPSINEWPFF